MDTAKQKSIKTSLFFHLVIALIISLLLSVLIQDLAYKAEQRIWLNYTENREELYGFQNAYSKKFGELPPIPSVNKSSLSKVDQWFVEVLDWLQTWSMLLISFLSVFLVLDRFYRHRLKKTLEILKDSAEKIGRRDLDFYVEYGQEDEMGQLCDAFEQMRLQLRDNNQMMWKMIEEQKQIRAAFSHDLRTPLSVLKGYVEYLSRYYPDERLSKEKVIEILKELSEQTQRIENFADTMKKINRLDEREVDQKLIDSATILKKSETILSTLSEKYGKTYSIQETIQQKEVKLDFDIYLEILENIAANAMRYAKKGIWLKLLDIESWLYMNVYDDGIGFSKEALKSARRPFYHELDESEGDHYGMGLYLCDNLCKKHGGKLSIGNQGVGGAVVKAQFRIK
ncbi:HAMP domain-containing sensor histidine kinase [Lachnospiraceae bacterium 48-21]|nr:HAMP domain-containing histidine kinase [Dorea sp.]